MMHVKTFPYRPRFGTAVAALTLLLLIVAMLILAAVLAPHAPGVSVVDRLGSDWSRHLHRRAGIWLGHRASFALAVLSLGLFFALICLRLHQAKQHTHVLLGRQHLVVPAIFWLSKPATVPYAAITRLRVEKRSRIGQWPCYFLVLQVSYEGDGRAQSCTLARMLLPNRRDFDRLCVMLSDNVRQANPAYIPDRLNLPYVSRADLGLAD